MDAFRLNDIDDDGETALQVEFIDDDQIMFTVIDKTSTQKEDAVVVVRYSELVRWIEQLRRPV